SSRSCVQRFRTVFFYTESTPSEVYTLSLHDALPIYLEFDRFDGYYAGRPPLDRVILKVIADPNTLIANILSGNVDVENHPVERGDRKSTRLNSSHRTISYAVFCLKKKKIKNTTANNT